MENYIKVSFENEKPKNGWFCDGVTGWVYDNGLVKCPHSGVIQQDVSSWLKKIIDVKANILYFTNDKNMLVKYDDENIVISHDNETGEFTFNRIRFRGDAGELLTPHYK